MKNLVSKVPLYIYIKIFKLKKKSPKHKKDKEAPYVLIQNDLQDTVSKRSKLQKFSNQCVEHAHIFLWE